MNKTEIRAAVKLCLDAEFIGSGCVMLAKRRLRDLVGDSVEAKAFVRECTTELMKGGMNE